MEKIDLLYIFNFKENLIDDAIDRLNYSINSINAKDVNIKICNYSKYCIKGELNTKQDFKYIHKPLFEEFSRSKTINKGVKDLVTSSYFILSDIDLIYSKNHFNKIKDIIDENKNPIRLVSYNLNQRPIYSSKFAYSRQKYLKRFYRKFSKKTKPQYFSDFNTLITNSSFFQKGFAHGNGLIHRETFDKIGGYDEEFIGYGPEDDMFNNRISFLNKLIYYEKDDLLTLHLWHPRYNMIQFKKNMKIWEERKNYLKTLKNPKIEELFSKK